MKTAHSTGPNPEIRISQKRAGHFPTPVAMALLTFIGAATSVVSAGTPPVTVGLVSSWTADDGTANDSYGSNQGTLQNGASTTAGGIGLGFRLDGVDDFVEIPDSPSVSTTGEITVAAWIKVETDSSATIASKYDSRLSNPQVSWAFLRLAGGKLRFSLEGLSRVNQFADTTSPVVPVGAFTHVAATFVPNDNANGIKIYVNGSRVAAAPGASSQAIGSIFDSTTPVQLGMFIAQSGPSSPFNGILDEVMLFNRALTGEEVKLLADPNAGRVSRWAADDGTARDSWGDNHGSLKNGASIAEGGIGLGFLVDGVDDFIEISDSPSLSPTGQIAVAAWIRSDTGAAGPIVSKYDSSQHQVSWAFTSPGGGKLRFTLAGPDGASYQYADSVNSVIPAGVLRHVAATFVPHDAANGIKLYVNGVRVAAASASDSTVINGIFDSTTPVRIGAIVNSSGDFKFFDGIVDEVVFFNRALAYHEISQLAASPNDGSDSPIEVPLTKAGMESLFDQVAMLKSLGLVEVSETDGTISGQLSNPWNGPISDFSYSTEAGSIRFLTGSNTDDAGRQNASLPLSRTDVPIVFSGEAKLNLEGAHLDGVLSLWGNILAPEETSYLAVKFKGEFSLKDFAPITKTLRLGDYPFASRFETYVLKDPEILYNRQEETAIVFGVAIVENRPIDCYLFTMPAQADLTTLDDEDLPRIWALAFDYGGLQVDIASLAAELSSQIGGILASQNLGSGGFNDAILLLASEEGQMDVGLLDPVLAVPFSKLYGPGNPVLPLQFVRGLSVFAAFVPQNFPEIAKQMEKLNIPTTSSLLLSGSVGADADASRLSDLENATF